MLWLNKNKFFNKHLPLILSVVLIMAGFSSYFIIHNSKPASSAWFTSSSTPGAWNYRQKITIDHTKIGQTLRQNLTDFPLLVSTTNVLFKDITNGGHVGKSDGSDIVFTAADGLTKLSHEIETYASSTGQLVAWVKIPTLQYANDTIIYMYYGNAAETGNEQNPTGVWDSNYKGVWHLADNVANKTVNDSIGLNNGSSNNNTNSLFSSSGKIDGAFNFKLASGDKVSLPTTTGLSLTGQSKTTIELWANFSATSTDQSLYNESVNSNNWRLYLGIINAYCPNGQLAFVTRDTSTGDSGSRDTLCASAPTIGSLQHIVATYDSVAGIKSLYINGQVASSTSSSVNDFTGTTNNLIAFGSQSNLSGYLFNGVMDELRVSLGTARSADWIKTEYNNQNSPSTFSAFGGEETQPTQNVKGAWYNSSWTYRKKLTIDKTKVSTASSTSLSNFPVLVSLTDTSLKSTANGGHMASSTAADLVFTDASGTVKLNHEIESYTPTTGQLIAWVQIPTLSPTADTDIYLYYGNSFITSSQANSTAVWDSNYIGVYHMKETLTGSSQTVADSTGINNGTSVSTWESNQQVAGKSNGSLSFNGTNNTIRVPNSTSLQNASTITFSTWVKYASSTPESHNRLFSKKAFWNHSNGWDVNLTQWGKIEVIGSGSSVVQKSCVIGWGNENRNQWHNVAVTINSTTAEVFCDGVSKGTGIVDSLVGSTPDVYLGSINNTGNFLPGMMDEVRVSNSSRTIDWIVTEYNNQNDPSVGGFYKAYGSEQVVPNSNWYQAWGYRKKVIINHTQVSGTSTLSSFPVLVSIASDPLLKTTANGGHMASSTAADLMFTSADGSTKIPHEIEKYDATTGQLIAWVKTDVSPFSDTVLYMYYGNPNVTTSQEDKTNVWSNGYLDVWHLNDNANSSSVSSSLGVYTGSFNNGIKTNQVSTTAKIDGGFANSGGSYVSVNHASSQDAYPLTISGWVSSTSTTNNIALINKYIGGSMNGYQIYMRGGSAYAFYYKDNGSYVTAGSYGLSGGAMNDGNWHLITFVVDAAGGNIYVDGSSKATVGWTGSAGAPTSETPVRFGYYEANLPGTLDEMRLSNVARTADWIKTEYNNQSAPTSFVTMAGEESSTNTTANTSWYSSDWGYRKKITIDKSKVTGPLTDFPVLISLTDNDLKTYASSTGADILFTSSDGITKLDHEIESYTSSTGQLIAWVKASSLSNSSDTVLYMYFGNSSAASQQNTTSVWSNNFSAVYHLGDNLSLNDSTSNYNLTNTGATSGTGKIDGSASLDGSNHYLSSTAGPTLSGLFTISAWARRTGNNRAGIISQGVLTNGIALVWEDAAHGNVLQYNNYSHGHSSLKAYTDSDWHYVVYTIDKNNPATVGGAFFVDGVLQWRGWENDTPAGGNIYIGQGILWNGWYFAGGVDEARLASVVRSDDWIKTEYNNQASPSTFYAIGALQANSRVAGRSGVGAASRGAASVGWHSDGGVGGTWTNRKKITVDHNKVSGTSTLSDFPLLFSRTDSEFKTLANGGKVANASGFDFVFTSSDGTTRLPHEIETYASTTGQLIAWVKTDLSPTSDTVLYLYYGNSSVASTQEQATSVWDSNYKGVWHLDETTTSDDLYIMDSTVNANNGSSTASRFPQAGTGKVDGAQRFTGLGTTADRIVIPNSSSIQSAEGAGQARTWSYWIYYTGSSGNTVITDTADGNGTKCKQFCSWAHTTPDIYASVSNANFAQSPTLVAYRWYLATFVYDGANLNLYINGVLVDTKAQTAPAVDSNYIIIGSWANGYATLMTFDEFRISNTSRSANWIMTEYNNQNNPSTFYAMGSSAASSRPSGTPLIKTRSGVKFR